MEGKGKSQTVKIINHIIDDDNSRLVHGIEQKIGRGVIGIEARIENGRLLIKVSDDGQGMDRKLYWSTRAEAEIGKRCFLSIPTIISSHYRKEPWSLLT